LDKNLGLYRVEGDLLLEGGFNPWNVLFLDKLDTDYELKYLIRGHIKCFDLVTHLLLLKTLPVAHLEQNILPRESLKVFFSLKFVYGRFFLSGNAI
jgi:hypothetical protein